MSPVITDKRILDRWTSFYGERKVLKFQYYNQNGIKTVIRDNSLKPKIKDMKEILKNKLEIKELDLEGAYQVIRRKISVGATNEFLLGYYAIQGLASQFVSHVVDPQPSDKILDMSAAPGGKTAHLASLMNNSGLIVAIDKSKHRLSALRSNLSRLGVRNVIAIEGRSEEIVLTLGQFDKVLLDAPCTGSGSICKTPNKIWTKNESDIFRLANIQERLLEKGIQVLKIGGTLTYSTCSIEPEESEFQIIKLLEKYPEVLRTEKIQQVKSFNFTSNEENPKIGNQNWIRLLPSDNYEGFFVCKLRKVKEIDPKG